jgi:hypothetical protein
MGKNTVTLIKAPEHRRTPKRQARNVRRRCGHVLECGAAAPLSSSCRSRLLFQPMLPLGGMVKSGKNLCARQSRFHLIKLLKTIALHAYATII